MEDVGYEDWWWLCHAVVQAVPWLVVGVSPYQSAQPQSLCMNTTATICELSHTHHVHITMAMTLIAKETGLHITVHVV